MTSPAPQPQIPSSEAYGEEYRTWKGWSAGNFGEVSKVQQRYYAAELRRTGLDLGKPLDVLEIGFGNGSFLAWARTQGWRIRGTEINPHNVEAARSKGFDVLHSDNFGTLAEGSFDLVVAFDVMEHIDKKDIDSFIAGIIRVLRPAGRFLARFPNGDSPFSAKYQNGDPTHCTWVGSVMVKELAARLGCTVPFEGGEARPLFTGNLKSTVRRLVTLPASYALNFILSQIIFENGATTLLSPNLVVILARQDAGAAPKPLS